MYNSDFERRGIHPKEHKVLTHGQEMEFALSETVVQDNPSSSCTHSSTGLISMGFHKRNASYALNAIQI